MVFSPEQPSKIWLQRARFWRSKGFTDTESVHLANIGLKITDKSVKKIAENRLRGVESIQKATGKDRNDSAELASNPFAELPDRGIFRRGVAKRITGAIQEQSLSRTRFRRFDDAGYTQGEARVLSNIGVPITSGEAKRIIKRRREAIARQVKDIQKQLREEYPARSLQSYDSGNIRELASSTVARQDRFDSRVRVADLGRISSSMRNPEVRARARAMEKDHWHPREIRLALKKRYPYLPSDVTDERSRVLHEKLMRSKEWRADFIKQEMRFQRISGKPASLRRAIEEANLELRRRNKQLHPDLRGEELDDMIYEGSL